jgi:predicted amidohydrolase YtcJ
LKITGSHENLIRRGRFIREQPSRFAAPVGDPKSKITLAGVGHSVKRGSAGAEPRFHLCSNREAAEVMVADLALISGRVRPLDRRQRFASAIAIADGEILAVGDDAAVRELCDSHTEVIDLGGAAVVPGLVDSHLHPFLGTVSAQGVSLAGATTLDEVRLRIAAERCHCDPHRWVLGYGLDYEVFADTGISGQLIEDAAGGGPALLMFNDLNAGLATPSALALAGIDGPRRLEPDAEIVCSRRGPTGELRKSAAVDLVRAVIPELTAAERYQMYADQLGRFAAVGLTGAHAMDGSLETLDLLRELESNGDLAIRLVTPFSITPDMTEADWARFVVHRDDGGRRWRAGVAKFFIDGAVDAGTAWLCEPDSEGEGSTPFWPDLARYRDAVRYFAKRGFQCVTHAAGDRAVREALDAYRAAGAARGVSHRIEHIETIGVREVLRFVSEGVVASMQPQHMLHLEPDCSDTWSLRLGPDRCDRAFPVRTLWESGALVALGSDWPVAHFDPRQGMAAARLRRPSGERDREPYDDEALDPVAALRGYTTEAAQAVGDHNRMGVLRAGAAADLTVFEEDPVDCDADELPQNPVRLTVVDGEITFSAGF